MNNDPCCDISGVCEAAKDAKMLATCIHCGKELQEHNGKWYPWDADLTARPRPQQQSDLNFCDTCHPTKINTGSVVEARYLTDDRDDESRNELVIIQGGNGDWYVAIVPEGEGCIGRGVRIATSGGASTRVPGLAPAIANAFRALVNAGNGDGVTLDLKK